MKSMSAFDHLALAKQLELQKKHAWDLEEAFPWAKGINLDKPFVPLDENNIAFPGASMEQRIALSQMIGLMVNETICEMECSLPRLKYQAWEQHLRRFPVNPEMFELGELFFEEEEKHAESFKRFLHMFCDQTGIDRATLKTLLPNALNSVFQKSMIWNAERGGHAFWWVVAAVEETSIQVFKAVHSNKTQIDPLFYELHKRHAEEEMRHENYAFLMLDLATHQPPSFKNTFFNRVDGLLSELVAGPWVLTELTKIFKTKELAKEHPFFATVASCIPLFEKMSKIELARALFTHSPYVSWLVNPAFRKKQKEMKQKHKSFELPLDEMKIDYQKLKLG